VKMGLYHSAMYKRQVNERRKREQTREDAGLVKMSFMDVNHSIIRRAFDTSDESMLDDSNAYPTKEEEDRLDDDDDLKEHRTSQTPSKHTERRSLPDEVKGGRLSVEESKRSKSAPQQQHPQQENPRHL